MVENFIRIKLIAELEKYLNLTLDIESSKLLTLRNTKIYILKYIKQKSLDKEVTVQPNTIEDYMIDELRGQTNINIDSVYYYIFPYILEFIDNYLDKTYLRYKHFAIHPSKK